LETRQPTSPSIRSVGMPTVSQRRRYPRGIGGRHQFAIPCPRSCTRSPHLVAALGGRPTRYSSRHESVARLCCLVAFFNLLKLRGQQSQRVGVFVPRFVLVQALLAGRAVTVRSKSGGHIGWACHSVPITPRLNVDRQRLVGRNHFQVKPFAARTAIAIGILILGRDRALSQSGQPGCGGG